MCNAKNIPAWEPQSREELMSYRWNLEEDGDLFELLDQFPEDATLIRERYAEIKKLKDDTVQYRIKIAELRCELNKPQRKKNQEDDTQERLLDRLPEISEEYDLDGR